MLNSKTILIYIFAISALVLPACSKKSGSDEPKIGFYEDYAKSTFAQAKKYKWQDACGDRLRDSILALTKTVDSHAKDVSQFLDNRRKTEPDSGEIIAGLYVFDDPKEFSSNKWQSSPFGWQATIDDAAKARTPYDWAAIGKRVNRLLKEDRKRTVYQSNFAMVPEEHTVYERAYEIAETCLKEKNCSVESFSEDMIEIIDDYWWNKSLLTQMDTADSKIRIEKATRLRDELRASARRFDLDWNKTVKRLSPKLIEVPLDPGPLAAAKEKLAALLEKKWKSKNLSVKIRWTNRKVEPDVYLITFDPTKAFVASVWTEPRLLKLSASSSKNTLTHELGHILGFQDHYYVTYYYGESCSYKFWYKTDDIMSDNMGVVTPTEWEALDRAYPVNGKNWGKEQVPMKAP